MTLGDYLNESNQLGALPKYPIRQRICKKKAKKTAFVDFLPEIFGKHQDSMYFCRRFSNLRDDIAKNPLP